MIAQTARLLLTLVLAATFGATPGVFADEATGGADAPASGDTCGAEPQAPEAGACKKIVQDCIDHGKTDLEALESALTQANQNVTDLQNTQDAWKTSYATSAGQLKADVADYCSSPDKCDSKCGKDKDKSNVKKCKDKLETAKKYYECKATGNSATAGTFAKSNDASRANPQSNTGTPDGSNAPAQSAKPQSASSGAGSGGGNMMGGLTQMMPMMMMAGMMMMAQQKKQDSSTAAAAVSNPNEALQANGTLDCSKYDGYIYHDCASYNTSKCAQEITNATYASDASCQQFSNRYCATGNTLAAYGGAIPASSQMPGLPPLASAGEGAGTAFCQQIVVFNFCQGAGRSSCPSCLQLARSQSSTCATNPEQCLAQNTTVVNQVISATSCPAVDPLYPAGTTTAATSAVASSTRVVLPQSVSKGSAMAGGGGGLSTASVSREGAGGNAGAVAGPASGALLNSGPAAPMAGGSNYRVASVTAVGRDVATTGANAGPASDVQGAYGQSLFNVSSQVYRQFCQDGRLNCN